MKNLLFLAVSFLLIFTSCNNNNNSGADQKQTTLKKDSIASVFSTTQLYSRLIARIGVLRLNLEKSGNKNTLLSSQIDSLQTNIIKSQTNLIHLRGIEMQVENFYVSNKQLLDNIAVLKDSNASIKNRLDNVSNTLYNATAENRSLKKAIKFSIANVQAKSYCHIHPLFRKATLVETTLAKNTEFIEITFVVVANSKVPTTTYPLNITLQSVGGISITKQILVNYNGSEVPCSKKFNDPQEFHVGIHDFEISLNKEILYTGLIELK